MTTMELATTETTFISTVICHLAFIGNYTEMGVRPSSIAQFYFQFINM